MDNYSRLTELALEWNEKINITAITNPEDFLRKNILDSLSVCGLPQMESAGRIMDLGTGGGYPGIPLAMHYPGKSFVLMDSVAKKLKVIDDICEKLEIRNVTTLHGRAEDLARDKAYRDSFDLVVSRAVANMTVLSEYALPFVRKGGFFIAYKTENALEEIAEAENAIAKLGGKTVRTVKAEESSDGHLLVIVEKLVETPKSFPRKAGEARRKPLL